jgi:cytoskeleton protein RodZ
LELCGVMSEFGASFKKARESLGISLKTISIETRISTRFLQAIEEEQFHLLPGGIFNRGFIRNYAERIGLDPEQAVADYEQVTGYREPVEGQTPSAQRDSEKSRFSLYPLAVGALILLILIFYVVMRTPRPQ